MKRAFTLIELLIVVAIIAILAAIAVPNFLEAQVRAKVSRCKADLRSIGLALECYRIDNNAYPVDDTRWNGLGFSIPPREVRVRKTFSMLTTPVAYISSILFDPFRRREDSMGGANSAPGETRHAYLFRTVKSAGSTVAGLQNQATNQYWIAYRFGYEWVAKSIGPMPDKEVGIFDAVLINGVEEIYDPTNGTISDGIILLTNKGFNTGQRQ